MDTSGNLYATTGVEEFGNVFKLTPGSDGWTYTDLFDFSSSLFSDGIIPVGGVVLDANGNIYGTTTEGGNSNPPCGEGCGVVLGDHAIDLAFARRSRLCQISPRTLTGTDHASAFSDATPG